MGQEQKLKEIQEKFENRISVLRDEMVRDLNELKQMAGSEGSSSDSQIFISYLKKLKDGYSQSDLLNILLDILADLTPRVMVMIYKDDTFGGWSARGFNEDFNNNHVKGIKWKVSKFPELEAAVKGGSVVANYSDLSEIADSISSFDDFSPVKSAFIPLLVRNKVAGLLYLDSGDTMELANLDALELLIHVASMELTMVTTKLKKKTGSEPAKTPQSEPSKPVEPEPVQPEPTPVAMSQPVSEPQVETNEAVGISSVGGEELSREEKKASRVARVLISDLILYNQEKVIEGRAMGSLYSLLQEDLDRSYEHYQSRTAGMDLGNRNYFKEELINQVAEGDEGLLGKLPF